MVKLRNDRKGMIAIMDALVFLILISIVTAGIFGYSAMIESEEPMAKTVSDQLFDIELSTNQLCQCEDTKIEHIYIIIAANMNLEDTERTESFIRSSLDLLVPELYGYALHIEFNGHTMDIERPSDNGISSQYVKEMDIGQSTMRSELTIY